MSSRATRRRSQDSVDRQHDWPRERLLRLGAGALTDAELIAVVLGTGLAGIPVLDQAHRLLEDAGGLERMMLRSALQWRDQPGLGQAKIARLLASVELGRRSVRGPVAPPQPLASPEAALELLRPNLVGLREERVVALFLDARRRPIEHLEIARGDPCRVPLDVAAVFGPALQLRAHALVLAHNHPSGDPTPSRRDETTTRALAAAGRVVGVVLEAHFVVAGERTARIMQDAR